MVSLLKAIGIVGFQTTGRSRCLVLIYCCSPLKVGFQHGGGKNTFKNTGGVKALASSFIR